MEEGRRWRNEKMNEKVIKENFANFMFFVAARRLMKIVFLREIFSGKLKQCRGTE